MSLFTAAELADLRAEQAAAMPDTCTLVTVTPGADDGGGGFGAPTTATASAACRVGQPTGDELVIASRLGQRVDVAITLPHDAAITTGGQIIAGGVTYEVLSTNAGGSWNTATRCLCRRVG